MILAIETSVPEASVCLRRGSQVVFEENFLNGRNHNSKIFDVLEKITEALRGETLSLVIVGKGPGSYSGTRVGIAAAQGIAIVHQCSVVGLGSLAATSVARLEKASMAVGDARRGLYYISEIKDSEAVEAELMETAEFQQVLLKATDEGKVLFTLDDPSLLNLDLEMSSQIEQVKPCAEHLIDIWLGLGSERRDALKKQPLSPAYLRAPFTSKAKSGHPLLRKL